MRVDYSYGGIHLNQRDGDRGGRRHTTDKKPEEEMFITQKRISRKRVGCGNSNQKCEDIICGDIDDRVEQCTHRLDITKNRFIVRHGSEHGKRSDLVFDFKLRFKACHQDRVERKHQKDHVDDGDPCFDARRD